MKRFLIVFFTLTLALPAAAQEQVENYIQVNGLAEIEIVPNQIYLSIVLDESDTKGRQEIELQRRQMISALKSLGINTEKQLTMENMSSSYYKRGSSLATAKYQLLLPSAEIVLAVYDKLSEMGISDINISRVSHSDIEQYKSQIRKQAMVNAKSVATELAEAVGQNIGACIYIYDANRGVTPTYYSDHIMMRTMAKAANEESVPKEEPVEFKKIKLNYSVTAKFRFKE